MIEPVIVEKDFSGGMFVSRTRGKEPPGTLTDVKNFIPVDKSLQSHYGYSTTGGLAALPTGFTVATAGPASTFDITGLVATPFPFSAENPTSYDGRVYFGVDNQGSPANHVMLDSWFWGSTTKVSSPNSGFVLLDERKTFSGADVTVATHTLTVLTPSSVGLSATVDYYGSQTSTPKRPPWIIEYNDGVNPKEYATVTAYSKTGSTSTITVKETIDGGGMGWTSGAGTYTLRRWFHKGCTDDSSTFGGFTSSSPQFASRPGQTWEAGDRVRGCGGNSLTTGYDPWHASYINRIFFPTGGSPITYQGTYVDMMECDGPTTSVIGTLSTPAAGGGVTPLFFSTGINYKIYYSLEYDGYEEGKLQAGQSFASFASGDVVQFTLSLEFAKMNKRITAVNIYLAQIAAGSATQEPVESSAYYIKRYSIVDDSTDSWVLTAAASSNSYVLATQQVNGDEWAARGGTYASRTGRTQDVSGTDRVHWLYSEVVSGRRFFANFYDFDSATVLPDEVRSTPIDSNGQPNYDIIPTDTTLRFNVATGDPGSIVGLKADKGFLHVFKDDSLFYGYITPEPEQWQINPISLQDGCAGVDSIYAIPGGGIAFADNDHFKAVIGGRIIFLTRNIEDTYTGLTKSGIFTWYDKIDRSLCFTNGTSTDKTFYKVFLDKPYEYEGYTRYPIFKVVIANEPQYVFVERDESVCICNDNTTFEGVFKWHSTDKLFNATTIIPYLKTHPKLVDETAKIRLQEVVIVKTKSGTSVGTLDNKIYIDGNQILRSISNPWVSQDKTKTQLYQKMSIDLNHTAGTTVQFEYNTNASGESSGTNPTDYIRIHEISFRGRLRPQPNQSR